MPEDRGDDRLTRETPSQAEGEEDMVEAQLKPGVKDKPDHDLFRTTPSQAEGSREVVDEMLEEQDERQDKQS
ncbi:MAG: hypothetical protein M3220_02260 [Chloroflexota bacterium]|nr:hypothetical protein [Chloroflexota bacterium]